MNNEKLNILGHSFFVLYFIFSVIFYRERLFADSAFYFFSIINFQDFFVVHSRYSAALMQFPTLLAVSLNLTLIPSTIIFSLSYSFYYYIIYIIISHILKKPLLALAVPFLLTLAVQHTFYWPVSEYSMSLTAVLLVYALIENNHSIFRSAQNFPSLLRRGLRGGLIAFVSIFSIFCHPASVLALLYVFLFDVLSKKKILKNVLVGLTATALALVIKLVFLNDNYETQQLHFLINITDPIYLLQLIFYFSFQKLILTLSMTAAVVFYIKMKYWSKMILILFFFIPYIIFVNLNFEAIYNNFYVENLYLALSLFISIPILVDIFPNIKNTTLKLILISLFFGFSLINIYSTSEIYKERNNFILDKALISNSTGSHKIIIENDNINGMTGNWSLPVESLVQTSIEGNTSSIVPAYIFSEVSSKFKIDEHSVILSPWNVISETNLNNKYFNIKSDQYRLRD